MPINPDTIAANVEFRRYMLAVMLHSDWLLRYGAIVMPEFFPTKEEQTFVTWLNDYWHKYNSIPDVTYAADLLAPEIVISIQTCEHSDLRYAADTLLDFCRVQAMKLAILESVDDIQKGDLHTPLGRIQTAQKVGLDHKDLGLELVADAGTWLYDELHGKKYPTGFATIDHALDGGLIGGEYGLIEAPPGMGKTMVLINLGYAMAGLFSACNVLHVTYELSVSKTLKRYGARATGIRVTRGEGDFDQVAFIAQLQARAKAALRGRLRVIQPGRRVDDIRRKMDQLAGEGFTTGALIIDYADLMTPPQRRKDVRFELADLARELRALGTEYDIPIWSATQAGRQAFYKQTIEMSDIAESIEKGAVADVILSLNQTKDEEKLGTGRIYAAKVRDGEGNMQVEVVIDRKRQIVMEKRIV